MNERTAELLRQPTQWTQIPWNPSLPVSFALGAWMERHARPDELRLVNAVNLFVDEWRTPESGTAPRLLVLYQELRG